ncbi:hypothetical protein CLAVI_000207 [Candidatus Clavichlamydia salmonicola]|uniref:hypothetical protein n=1 Tax=Candidatus Clavichlamydia salmonicola TaxID=469812 RepID=UPI00189199C6|nr:hypothetical protein [Candidatus Clavichlamydia salmonicola]MBF5050596.1 hypothetical protein [Candidatus Clavichlamydia salmonicola]
MTKNFLDFAFRHTVSSSQEYEDAFLFAEDFELYDILKLAPLQNYCLNRFHHLVLVISKKLTTHEILLNHSLLQRWIKQIDKTPFFSGPLDCHDAKMQQHLFLTLKKLDQDPSLSNLLQRLVLPRKKNLCDIIRKTLHLHNNESLQIHHVRQAVLSALLSFSDLSSSSYATAFRLLIQTNFPKLFLEDMLSLTQEGALIRSFKGKNITAPINTLINKKNLFSPIKISTSLPAEKILSYCPGIIAGALAVGIISIKMTPSEQTEQIKKLLANLIQQGKLPSTSGEWTASHIFEELIKEFGDFQSKKTSKDQSFSYTNASINSTFHKDVAYALAIEAFLNETNNSLLDAWEFTLASFPTQDEAQRANHLNISLGILSTPEPFSFTETLSLYVTDTVAILKKEMEECEIRAEHIKAAVAQMQSSALYLPPNKQQHIFAEYRLRKAEYDRAVYEWSEARRIAELVSLLPEHILRFYSENLPHYFQSFYASNNIKIMDDNFADEDAVFMLFYTHGRENSDLWTPLNSLQEFTHAISTFLNITEHDLKQQEFAQDIERYLSSAVSSISQNVLKAGFLEAAVTRLSTYYNVSVPMNIVENQDFLPITPWKYESTTAMHYLLESYNLLPKQKIHISKRPETYEELLVFFIDNIKDCPGNFLKKASYQKETAIIASSPFFSFLALPGESSLKNAWDTPYYTPSWVKDFWAQPQYSFLQNYLLNSKEACALWQKCRSLIPLMPPLSSLIQKTFAESPISIPNFTSYVLEAFNPSLPKDICLKFKNDLHGAIFSLIPLSEKKTLPINIRNIFDYMGITSIAYELFSQELEPSLENIEFLSASELHNICKGLAILSYKKAFTSDDFHKDIATAMKKLGLKYPDPILIGSLSRTNQWLGFTVNPSTALIDLWSFDPSGTTGKPFYHPNGSSKLLHGSVWKIFFPPIEIEPSPDEEY